MLILYMIWFYPKRQVKSGQFLQRIPKVGFPIQRSVNSHTVTKFSIYKLKGEKIIYSHSEEHF